MDFTILLQWGNFQIKVFRCYQFLRWVLKTENWYLWNHNIIKFSNVILLNFYPGLYPLMGFNNQTFRFFQNVSSWEQLPRANIGTFSLVLEYWIMELCKMENTLNTDWAQNNCRSVKLLLSYSEDLGNVYSNSWNKMFKIRRNCKKWLMSLSIYISFSVKRIRRYIMEKSINC